MKIRFNNGSEIQGFSNYKPEQWISDPVTKFWKQMRELYPNNATVMMLYEQFGENYSPTLYYLLKFIEEELFIKDNSLPDKFKNNITGMDRYDTSAFIYYNLLDNEKLLNFIGIADYKQRMY